MKRIIALIKTPYRWYMRKRKPVIWAKKIGVNMGDDIHIYGEVGWSTEPWIITLGNHVHITSGVQFITHDGGTLILRHLTPDLELTGPITVGDYVYIGTNAMILPNVKIGNNCIIAAGSIVTKDIPDGSVVAGVPARVIKTIEEYHKKAKKNSLHLGHLLGADKDKELRRIFNYHS